MYAELGRIRSNRHIQKIMITKDKKDIDAFNEKYNNAVIYKDINSCIILDCEESFSDQELRETRIIIKSGKLHLNSIRRFYRDKYIGTLIKLSNDKSRDAQRIDTLERLIMKKHPEIAINCVWDKDNYTYNITVTNKINLDDIFLKEI